MMNNTPDTLTTYDNSFIAASNIMAQPRDNR